MTSESARATGGGDGYIVSPARGVRAFLAASPPFLPTYNNQPAQYPGAQAQAHCGAYARPPFLPPPPLHHHRPHHHHQHQQPPPHPHPPPQQQQQHSYQHQHFQPRFVAPGALSMHQPGMMPMGSTSGNNKRGGPTPPLQGLMPEPPMHPRKRPCRQQSPSPSPPPQYQQSPSPLPQEQQQQEQPSPQILAQNCIPVLAGVRQGELLGSVGLLPSLQADFMRAYEVRWGRGQECVGSLGW
jgi:hypothetical protein